jgi:formylglycine-generating enzyme required for sulfatase activity
MRGVDHRYSSELEQTVSVVAALLLGLSAAACGAAPPEPNLGALEASGPSAASLVAAPSPSPTEEPMVQSEPGFVHTAQSSSTARDGMRFIPAGPYWTGCDKGKDPFCREQDEAFRQVELGDYQIDTFEVTVRNYAACVEAGACDATRMGGFVGWKNDEWMYCNWGKAGKDEHPINCVSWEQADTYCSWAGKRLPSAAEWEKAARGTDKRAYPWGDEMISCEYAVTNETAKATDKGCGENTTQPVGSKPKGVSPYGVHDIVGNVWEWTADRYVPPPGAKDVRDNERVGKGGCWGSGNPWNSRISWSHHYPADYRSNIRLGFRCAADVEREPQSTASR